MATAADVQQAQTFWLNHLASATAYNSWVFSQIRPHLGNHVLEVGCGTGNFTEPLGQHCSRVVAIDLNSTYVELSQARLKSMSNVELFASDVMEWEWEYSFDTIVMLDVLEHIENDVKLLKKLHRGLQPGGKLILKVPAMNCLYSELDRAIGHHRRYGTASLSNALAQADFTNSTLWYFNVLGILGWWWNGKCLKRSLPASEQINFFNQAVPLLQRLESRLSLPIGASLFAVAIKE